MQHLLDEGPAFVAFLAGLPQHYASAGPTTDDLIGYYLQAVPLWPNQFLYIHDMRAGQFHHKGFDRCLGYSLDELTADFFVRNIHPADRSTYFRVSKALLAFVLRYSPELVPFVTTFQINYRVRRRDGTYITVLRQSTPLVKNGCHEVEAYLSFCTDISLIATSTHMKWQLQGPRSDEFPQFLTGGEAAASHVPLSGRELEVLRLLGQGLSSLAISKNLYISLNTVNSHRKSLLKKAGVTKTVSLLAFARDHGYL